MANDPRGVLAQRAHIASYYGVYPGNSPENLPPLEACMSNSKLRNSNVSCSQNYPLSKTSHSITSFQSSELTELSPPFKIFTVAASCLLASRDRCVVLGARGLARDGGVADFDGLLPRSSGGGEGLREHGGGESALGMAKEMDSTLHCRFTTFTASRKYSKWTNPSGANPTIVASTRTPLERV